MRSSGEEADPTLVQTDAEKIKLLTLHTNGCQLLGLPRETAEKQFRLVGKVRGRLTD